jgi:hypothetical protein
MFRLWRMLAVVTACGASFGVIRLLGEELICPGILFAIVIGGAGMFLTPWEWGRLIALLLGVAVGVGAPIAIGFWVGEPYGWLMAAFGGMLGLPLGPFVTDRLWHRLTRSTAGNRVVARGGGGVE